MFRFFNKKKPASAKSEPIQDTRTVEEMRDDPNLIQIFDEYGREMFVDKDTWRKDMLPGNLKKAWSKPDELYGVIYQSLMDGFEADVVKAARRLYEIDPLLERAACILGIVYMKNGRLNEAEQVLQDYLKKHGEEGSVLTNLAKVYAAREQHELSEQTLWHALEVDPNQDNGLGWYEVIHRERDGEQAGIEALRRVAELPGSWRAQLWLARAELEAGNLDTALDYYQLSLSRAGRPVPSDLLMQMSGDLGNNGHLNQIGEWVEPLFAAEVHGLLVGNNLIRAQLELGETAAARKVLDQLYAQNRPDWKPHLEYWDKAIDEKEHTYGPVEQQAEKISATLLMMPWPVWSHKLKDLDRVMPAKAADAPSIAFFAGSCTLARKLEQCEVQRPNSEGILSRCIPLYLAEQVQMLTSSKGIYLVPIISGEGSFILSGAPSSDATFLEQAVKSGCDFAVNAHLDASGASWEMKLTLMDLKKGEALCVISETIDPENPARGTEELALKMKSILRQRCGFQRADAPIQYEPMRGEELNTYLHMAESTLSLSSATCKDVSPDFLFGTRRTFDSLIDLNLKHPQHAAWRLMLIGALAKNKAYGETLYKEYRTKTEKLQHDHPLQGVTAQLAADTISALFNDE